MDKDELSVGKWEACRWNWRLHDQAVVRHWSAVSATDWHCIWDDDNETVHRWWWYQTPKHSATKPVSCLLSISLFNLLFFHRRRAYRSEVDAFSWISLFMGLFVNAITTEWLNVRWWNLVGKCIVKQVLPKVIWEERVATPQGRQCTCPLHVLPVQSPLQTSPVTQPWYASFIPLQFLDTLVHDPNLCPNLTLLTVLIHCNHRLVFYRLEYSSLTWQG